MGEIASKSDSTSGAAIPSGDDRADISSGGATRTRTSRKEGTATEAPWCQRARSGCPRPSISGAPPAAHFLKATRGTAGRRAAIDSRAGVSKLRRAVTLFPSRRKIGATSKQAKARRSCRRVLGRARYHRACASWGRPVLFFANAILVHRRRAKGSTSASVAKHLWPATAAGLPARRRQTICCGERRRSVSSPPDDGQSSGGDRPAPWEVSSRIRTGWSSGQAIKDNQRGRERKKRSSLIA